MLATACSYRGLGFRRRMCTHSIERFNFTLQLTISLSLLPAEIGHIPTNRSPFIKFNLLPRDDRPAGGQVPRGISVLLTKLDSYFTRGALGMSVIRVVCKGNRAIHCCGTVTGHPPFPRVPWVMARVLATLHVELSSTSCGVAIGAGHNIFCSRAALQP